MDDWKKEFREEFANEGDGTHFDGDVEVWQVINFIEDLILSNPSKEEK